MSLVIYNIAIKAYLIIIYLVSFKNQKAKQWIKGREKQNLKEKFAVLDNKNIIWFHAASLGEFEQGRPLIEVYKKQNPKCSIVLSFFSPSGYEIKKNYEIADLVCYLPIDSKKNAKEFIEIIKPQKVFFIKYEYWYHYINELSVKKIPLYLISAKFTENQIFFKWYGVFFKNILTKFSTIFVQDKNSKILLNKNNISNCIVAGDTRFDRVSEIYNSKQNYPLMDVFTNNSFVVVCGSTWPTDDDIIISYINNSKLNIKFIIAPHELNKEKLQFIKNSINVNSTFYSELNNKNVIDTKVIIIDSIGKLSYFYRFGKIAYIGNGFGKGIHNTLEAAVYGMPVIFGPNYKKFIEAINLKELGAAIIVKNQQEFNNSIEQLFNNTEILNKKSEIAKKFVTENIGASEKILENIK